ncbi:succinyl-diaminopimelate desuccinylase [Elioraea sp.]|uniref:succinyl-diaminopimelate desuccinylase n=1 Tax=Elioraea sp. TaxID=2185103 RepID=UPI0025BA5832|nr:succinyl-diaminopimelate desuccinylase [Elioraea sp.]
MTDAAALARDPAGLAAALIRCPSVTPEDAGAQTVLAEVLTALGFTCTDVTFGAVRNLYARIGPGRPALCFAGHTDVVPPGNAAWTADPFGAEVRDGVLYGRGAVDMKGNIAAFVAATAAWLDRHGGNPPAAISFLITGDEEGDAIDGTVKVLEWMEARQEIPGFCLVGEPTSVKRLGDTIKIGRRGSLTGRITVEGTQGHAAYPQFADNAAHRLVALLSSLASHELDRGTDWFEPSSLQVTTIDIGNPASNVIPGAASATWNIRFNDRHTEASLAAWLRREAEAHTPRHRLAVSCSGEAFLTEPGEAVDALAAAIARATGVTPKLDTGGGTSDARFISRYCPVAEFGLVGTTMHKADERVPVAELAALAITYEAVIDAFCR